MPEVQSNILKYLSDNPDKIDDVWPQWSAYIPHFPFPQQLAFLLLNSREAFYGGAAGGGKSDALLMAALQYVHIPGYAAILFRRKLTDAHRASAIADRAMSWLEGTDAVYKGNKFYFPSGATLSFGYLDNEGDIYDHQGAEYSFCVAKGTLVRMGNGSLKAIEEIQIGEYVLTLEGPKQVQKTYPRMYKECVEVNGQIQATNHRVLTPYGWYSYDQLLRLSKQSHAAYNIDESLTRLHSKSSPLLSCLSSDFRQPSLPDLQNLFYTPHQGAFSYSTNDRNDYEVFDDSLPTTSQLPKLSFPLMLYEPDSLSTVSTDRPYVKLDDYTYQSVRDYLDDYSSLLYRGDEQFLTQSNNAQVFSPLLNDVEEQSQLYCNVDVLGNVLLRNRIHLTGYVHPYTKEDRSCSLIVEAVPCQFTPVGVREVYDMQIADASNYITSSNIVQSNCGFDELTQFPEHWYTYLFSRMRRPVTMIDPRTGLPIPVRMRAASNPGGMGHIWVKKRFGIQEVYSQNTGKSIYRGTIPGRPYVPSFVTDNPYIDKDYQDNLRQLDPVTREQLLKGDWGVVADGRFRKSWAKYYSRTGDYINLGMGGTGQTFHVRKCRVFQTIDPAGSTREGPGDEQIWKRQPSNFVISTWLLTPSYDLLWADCVAFRKEIPDAIKKVVEVYRHYQDISLGPEFVGIEPNGNGLGVYQACNRMGLPVRPLRPRAMDKLVRATDAMNRMEQGRIWFPEDQIGWGQNRWLEDTESELYTWLGHPDQACDRIDTLAYAAMYVSTEAGLYGMGMPVRQTDMPNVTPTDHAKLPGMETFETEGYNNTNGWIPQ